MDWSFLIGFALGSAILFGYHLLWIYRLTTSNTEKFRGIRSDIIALMIELGEVRELTRKDK